MSLLDDPQMQREHECDKCDMTFKTQQDHDRHHMEAHPDGLDEAEKKEKSTTF